MRWQWLVVATIALAITPGRAPADEPEAVSFTREIAPILVKQCQACHGTTDAKSDYQVTNFDSWMKPGASGEPAITAGDPATSEVYRLIASTDTDERMPKEGDALSADQVALFERWIREGAKFDGPDSQAALSSIIPKPAHPDPPATYRAPLPVTALAFRPDGGELAIGGYREITIWNPADGSLLRRIKNVAERTYGVAYHPAGNLLAAASGVPGQMGEVKLFDPQQGTLVKDLGTMSDVAFDVTFNADGSKLAACGADRSIRIYDVASGQQVTLIEDHADWVMSIAFSADGARLASASRDKTSKVFEVQTGDAQTTFPDHGQTVFGVSFNADGTQVYTCGADNKIRVWNPADGKQIAEIAGYGHEVHKVQVRGPQIFSCAADKTVRLHGIEQRNEVRKFEGLADWAYCLAVNEPSKRVAAGAFDGEVRVWNLDDGATIASFKAAPGYVPPAPPAP